MTRTHRALVALLAHVALTSSMASVAQSTCYIDANQNQLVPDPCAGPCFGGCNNWKVCATAASGKDNRTTGTANVFCRRGTSFVDQNGNCVCFPGSGGPVLVTVATCSPAGGPCP